MFNVRMLRSHCIILSLALLPACGGAAAGLRACSAAGKAAGRTSVISRGALRGASANRAALGAIPLDDLARLRTAAAGGVDDLGRLRGAAAQADDLARAVSKDGVGKEVLQEAASRAAEAAIESDDD